MATVFGFHSVKDQLQHAPEQIHRLVVLKDSRDRRRAEVIREAKAASIRIQYVTRPSLDRMSGGGNHQGLLAEIHQIQTHSEEELRAKLAQWETPLILILEDIQDSRNVGACLRTAMAVGVDAVIVPRSRSGAVNSTVLKTASGAVQKLFLVQVANLARTITWLKEAQVWVVGTDDKAKSSYLAIDYDKPIALVMGNEEKGIRRLTKDLCDHVVSIPVTDAVSSLNVSVANGILLYEVLRQRSA